MQKQDEQPHTNILELYLNPTLASAAHSAEAPQREEESIQ
jgi:hypothetical protein